MNKSHAIKKKCLDCAGGSTKEVTLCPVVDCPLWPFRFGSSDKTKAYRLRMKKAEGRWPDEYREVNSMRNIRKREERVSFREK
jgi:hypothetical protein